ncbi:MAG: hypothetical protein ACR2HP_00820 [Ilumatobacteraceae bacterium]
MRSRVGSALVLCAMFMACDADEAVPAASTTSTAFVEPVSTAPSTAPTTSTAIPSSVPNEVVVESAVYDAEFAEVRVRAPGPSGDVPVLDTAEVRLRFAPGVGCG